MPTAPSAEAAPRYQRDQLAEVVTEALSNLDFAHVAVWTASETCPCRELAPDGQEPGERECLAVQVQDSLRCEGYAAEVPMPDGNGFTIPELIAALPEPDADGMVGGEEAGQALGAFIRSRLHGKHDYTARNCLLRLSKAFDEFEGTALVAEPDSDMPRCRWCGNPVKDRRATYCSPAHRNYGWRQVQRQKAKRDRAAGDDSRPAAVTASS